MINPEERFDLCKQRRKILACKGHLLVTGSAGSGKTTIAILKARRAVLDGLAPGQSVLFLSFSNAAIRRLIASADDLLDAELGKRVEIRTYHSFAWDILRTHGYLLSTQRAVQVVSAQDADVISAGIEDDAWAAEQERLFVEDGRLIYDQFAPQAVALVKRSKNIRRCYSGTYPLIFVDEFQDTDDAQWQLIKTLGESSQIVALGDKDQRIYEWRKGVDEKRLEHFASEFTADVFDFGEQNNRSPGTGIASYARSLLNLEGRALKCEDVKEVYFAAGQFPAIVKMAVIRAFLEVRKRTGSENIAIGVAARSRALVRLISDALSGTQTVKGRVRQPISHEVMIDQSQVFLAGRVVAYLLKFGSDDNSRRLSRCLELVADMHKAARNKTNIEKSDRLNRWAADVRKGTRPKTKCVTALAKVLEMLNADSYVGAPGDDWIFARDALQLAGVGELEKVADMVRFLRVLRRGSAIEGNLTELWRTQGNYIGAVDALERAIVQEQILDSERPPTACTVMTMHQLKGREFDGIVLVEDEHRTFLGQEKNAPYMDSRRLLQMSLARARKYAVVVSPKGKSTIAKLTK